MLRYNFFGLIFTGLATKILRAPALSYFDDSGPLVQDRIRELWPEVFLKFPAYSVGLMKGEKSEAEKELPLLCLRAEFHRSGNNTALRIFPPMGKWGNRTRRPSNFRI